MCLSTAGVKTPLVALFCFAGVFSCAAQDKAVLPYQKLYEAFQKAATVKSTEVRAVIVVVPKDGAVKPGDVTFTIQAKGGAQKLAVDPDGEIHGFPLSAELLKENPSVVTNQPKGTLNLGGGLAAVLPKGATYSYQQLAALFDAGNAQVKEQAGLLSFVAPAIKSLTFEFFAGGGQTLTVASKVGPKTIKADAKGQLVFTLEKVLVAENPAVTLSEPPSKAILDF